MATVTIRPKRSTGCAISGWRRRWVSAWPKSTPTCRSCGPDASGPQLRAALQRKLADIDQRIDGLQALRAELARRLGEDMQACPLQAAPSAREAPGVGS